jgi:ribosomal protein S18 acetylase RimI-like enzyme
VLEIMGKQIAFVIKTLKFIQDDRIFTWRTPLLAVQYLIKLIFEKLGSMQSLNMKPFLPERNGEYVLLPARDRADVEKAQKLYAQSFEDEYGAVLLAKLYQQFPHLSFVVLKGEALVGYCFYTIDPALFSKRRAACLYSLAVDARFRGAGQAKFMVEKTLAYLKENDLAKVYLHVRPENKYAIKLYEHFGFKQVGVVKGINPKRNQMWLMEARIDGPHSVEIGDERSIEINRD